MVNTIQYFQPAAVAGVGQYSAEFAGARFGYRHGGHRRQGQLETSFGDGNFFLFKNEAPL